MLDSTTPHKVSFVLKAAAYIAAMIVICAMGVSKASDAAKAFLPTWS